MTFSERHVEADGLRIRYMEAGQGIPLVHLHEAGAFDLTPAHDILSRHARVLAFEMPRSSSELASVMARAIGSLGLDTFNLLATSRGATTALRLTLQAPAGVLALVLESPAATGADGRDVDLERRLQELATPTLVLCGTKGDSAGRIYKELLPNSHFVFVYDAGRAIGRERPEAFAEVVGDFLERREAFVISRAGTVIHP